MSKIDFWIAVGLVVLAVYLVLDLSIDHLKNRKKS
jgi:hypothetical protein